jgi:hypothetical protein
MPGFMSHLLSRPTEAGQHPMLQLALEATRRRLWVWAGSRDHLLTS